MNKALLEQIAAAKDAGTKAMAKDFFAPTPGAGGEEEMPVEGDMQTSAPSEGETMPGAEGVEGAEQLSPEQLEELLQLLQAQGGAPAEE